MKKWIADYSIRYTDGHIEELQIKDIESPTITGALATAEGFCKTEILPQSDVEAVIIWNIGIYLEGANYDDLEAVF